MIALQFLLVVFSIMLMAAHFLRASAFLMMALCFGLMALLFVRRPWAARVLQGWLLLGTAVWILTAISAASDRLAQGKPAIRLLVILGTVGVVTALGAVTIQRGRMGRYFGIGK
jgi:hypothetical protein